MSTPNLRTFVRDQVTRRDFGMQTAFPAKVVSFSSATHEVSLEPQFIETWLDGANERTHEGDTTIQNVPVCFPHFMSWTIDTGTFGLVICTKYSLNKWRNDLQRVDPGDLRRFTMSGATFHPVVMGRSPSVAQDYVALSQTIDAFLLAFINTTPGTADGGLALQTACKTAVGGTWTVADTVGSSRVKAEI